jgi:FAD/FMN-containing dehydrogenase
MITQLQKLLGADHVLTGETADPYCQDWRGRYAGSAIAVVFPSNTAQVAAVVKLCAEQRVAIVPQGGNTSLCGGSVPLPDRLQLVINLSRMKQIIDVDVANGTMTVEAGCTLAQVCAAAKAVDRLFPLGLNAIAQHCEIGGNISTNAGGIGVLRYGNMRNMVLGLEVVLPDGRIWNGLRGLRKDNTGYDLKHLFIGAEGTLGIVTQAVLQLFPQPESIVTALIGLPSATTATRVVEEIRRTCGNALSAVELMSGNCIDLVLKHIPGSLDPFQKRHKWYVLIQLSSLHKGDLEESLRAGITGITAAVFEYCVTSETSIAEQWWVLRRNISEAQKREGMSIKHDIAVPVSKIATFLLHAEGMLISAFPNVRIVAFGHMGDGNIHYNVSLPVQEENQQFIARKETIVNRLVYQVVGELNGSISAEHGIGQLKRGVIHEYKTAVEMDLMLKIKNAFDPYGLMNPGKLIDSTK